MQQTVSGACASGSSIRDIGQDGTVVCQTDGGIRGYTIVQVSSNFDTDPLKSALATCPTGKTVIGGGARISTSAVGFSTGSSAVVAIIASEPFGSNDYVGNADYMGGPNASPGSWRVIASAICATGVTF